MDGSEIDDIEAEPCDVRNTCNAIVESAVLARRSTLTPRDHFIPCTRAGKRPVGTATPVLELENYCRQQVKC